MGLLSRVDRLTAAFRAVRVASICIKWSYTVYGLVVDRQPGMEQNGAKGRGNGRQRSPVGSQGRAAVCAGCVLDSSRLLAHMIVLLTGGRIRVGVRRCHPRGWVCIVSVCLRGLRALGWRRVACSSVGGVGVRESVSCERGRCECWHRCVCEPCCLCGLSCDGGLLHGVLQSFGGCAPPDAQRRTHFALAGDVRLVRMRTKRRRRARRSQQRRGRGHGRRHSSGLRIRRVSSRGRRRRRRGRHRGRGRETPRGRRCERSVGLRWFVVVCLLHLHFLRRLLFRVWRVLVLRAFSQLRLRSFRGCSRLFIFGQLELASSLLNLIGLLHVAVTARLTTRHGHSASSGGHSRTRQRRRKSRGGMSVRGRRHVIHHRVRMQSKGRRGQQIGMLLLESLLRQLMQVGGQHSTGERAARSERRAGNSGHALGRFQ